MQRIQVVGAVVSMLFIVGMISGIIYYTRNLPPQEKVLFMFMFVTSMMTSVWVIDNVFVFRTKLLTEEEDDFILTTMNTIIALTVGLYFGSKMNESGLK